MAKQYQSYTLEAFISDPDFRNWVLSPTPEQTNFWQAWITKHPEKADLVEEAANMILAVHHYFDREPTDSQTLIQQFEEISQKAEIKGKKQHDRPIIRRLKSWQLAIAASILLLVCMGGWAWISQQNQYVIYATAYGEWETVSLPDGSTVTLNANSELKLSKQWENTEDRTVWLTGEAFFEVEKKPTSGAKFYVITDGVSVEVLGTSFNVNYRGETTEVFLEEGIIKMEAGKEEAYMEPGDFIAYSANSGQIIENRKGVNEIQSSWKDGVLIMQEVSVEEIFNKIADIYGVAFQVTDSSFLYSKTTIGIPMDKLEITLPILEKTLGKTIQKTNNHLIVH